MRCRPGCLDLTPDGEERPLTRHALQSPLAAMLEFHVRPCHQQGDGSRDPYLPRIGVLSDAGSDMDPDAPDVVATDLDLARMDASTDLQGKSAQGVAE